MPDWGLCSPSLFRVYIGGLLVVWFSLWRPDGSLELWNSTAQSLPKKGVTNSSNVVPLAELMAPTHQLELHHGAHFVEVVFLYLSGCCICRIIARLVVTDL